MHGRGGRGDAAGRLDELVHDDPPGRVDDADLDDLRVAVAACRLQVQDEELMDDRFAGE